MSDELWDLLVRLFGGQEKENPRRLVRGFDGEPSTFVPNELEEVCLN